MNKITIVGAGRVGETTAQQLAVRELAPRITLLDIREGIAKGIALDIQQSCSLNGFDTQLAGDTDPKAMADSDIVVLTAGLPRKPGMSRSDVLQDNLKIIRLMTDDVQTYAPQAIVIIVTNPVDVLTYDVWRRTGWDRRRVIGLSGVLDAARMAAFIAMETGYSSKDITTMVLGGHGDLMVPMSRYSCIQGIPLDNFMNPEAIERIVERTRKGGAEILSLKKSSSANDSPATSIVTMIDAIVHNRRRILPCVAILEGEFGQRDLAMGVPCVLSNTGLERVVELNLSEKEAAMFATSVQSIRNDLARAGDPEQEAAS